jgi:hypothetical protein
MTGGRISLRSQFRGVSPSLRGGAAQFMAGRKQNCSRKAETGYRPTSLSSTIF